MSTLYNSTNSQHVSRQAPQLARLFTKVDQSDDWSRTGLVALPRCGSSTACTFPPNHPHGETRWHPQPYGHLKLHCSSCDLMKVAFRVGTASYIALAFSGHHHSSSYICTRFLFSSSSHPRFLHHSSQLHVSVSRVPPVISPQSCISSLHSSLLYWH